MRNGADAFGTRNATHMTSKFRLSKVGCPIRKSAGQRLFAPHHSLSQRTTSFIASYRQGIHQMPLGHLIALISNARHFTIKPATPLEGGPAFRLLGKASTAQKDQKSRQTQMKQRLQLHALAHHANPKAGMPGVSPLYDVQDHRQPCGRRNCCSLQRLQQHSQSTRRQQWWSQTGSNRRPPACKAGALPAELWPRYAWWAWEDLNFRPHAYQARALTN
jgi:hypothetical protein